MTENSAGSADTMLIELHLIVYRTYRLLTRFGKVLNYGTFVLTSIKLLLKYVIKAFMFRLVSLAGQGTVVFSLCLYFAFTITHRYRNATVRRTWLTATVNDAIIGLVIAFVQTLIVCVGERSTRKDTKDENENCDFEVRHLQNQGCVD